MHMNGAKTWASQHTILGRSLAYLIQRSIFVVAILMALHAQARELHGEWQEGAPNDSLFVWVQGCDGNGAYHRDVEK